MLAMPAPEKNSWRVSRSVLIAGTNLALNRSLRVITCALSFPSNREPILDTNKAIAKINVELRNIYCLLQALLFSIRILNSSADGTNA